MRLGKLARLTVAAAFGFSSPTFADSVTIIGFGGAFQDAMRVAYFEPYTKETGTEVQEDTYNGGIAKLKAMVQTNSQTWDVVQMDENEMILACDEGLLASVTADELGIADSLMDQAKQTDCGVGFVVWSTILSYDKPKLDSTPKNWADMWDTEKYPGKRGLRKQARLTLEVALLADGVAPDEVYEVLATKEGADRAFAKLEKIKSDIVWWESGAQPIEWLASGDVVMTAAYNGRVSNANKEGKDFGIAWENQLYAMDFWAIAEGSDVETAKEFIKFAMQAKNQKAFTDAIPYGVTNNEARDLIDPTVAPDLPTSPDNIATGVSVSTSFWVDHEEELQTRFTQWLAN